eukprot:Skav229266  [mRNA]  locus=scaffold952:149754:151547:+ [translate_table: standard]
MPNKGFLHKSLLLCIVELGIAGRRGCTGTTTYVTHDHILLKSFSHRGDKSWADICPCTHVLWLLLAPNHVSRMNAISNVYVRVHFQHGLDAIERERCNLLQCHDRHVV